MGLFTKDKKDNSTEVDTVDTYDIDPEDTNRFTSALLNSLDRAVAVQSGVIIKYVENLKKRNKDASPQQLQELIDKHFLNITSGTGAAAGASAATQVLAW